MRRKKLETLYFLHRDYMFTEAFDVLRDHSLAEDAVNEAFVHIIPHINKIEEDGSFYTRNFLCVVCRNAAIDIYRRQKREDVAVIKAAHSQFPDETPEDILITRESLQEILDIINDMNPKYRDVILMNKIYNIRQREIASMLHISEDAVKKRLQRARAEIKAQLQRRGK
ncbi:MAG: sigma-70 family RNA polymerase sigma factor [Clostridia bacterium]|nr:sigma-70 family RNA polymerase sigma factor [Clostridia bacterium]